MKWPLLSTVEVEAVPVTVTVSDMPNAAKPDVVDAPTTVPEIVAAVALADVGGGASAERVDGDVAVVDAF